jgi:oligoendopeptidase F
MTRFEKELASGVSRLLRRATALKPLTRGNAGLWEKLLLAYEEIRKRYSHLSSYVDCLVAADSRNEDYLSAEARLATLQADFAKIRAELRRGVKKATEPVFSSLVRRPGLSGAAHYLKRLRHEARNSMPATEERLAEDLHVNGLHAWGRLYDRVSGKLEFSMEYPDGRRERVPISQRRALMEHPDRRVRKAAFAGGNEAWRSVEESAAAALNAIAGTRLTLNRYRGVRQVLDVALFQAGMTRKTLAAMMDAVQTNLAVPRRILKLKAKVMGTKGVGWYDLGAPLFPSAEASVPWERAKRMIGDAFARGYPALARFFASVCDENWVDWEPRAGKRPGGFCTGSLLTGESRIFMTYNGAPGDVLTLAHETGHAFHSHVMRDLRPYARGYPMTLAETASTFGEMLLVRSLLSDPATPVEQKATLLDMETGHAVVYLMDIPVRYRFERAFYEERAAGELSVSRCKELMVETQRRIFGDVLEEGGEDPYLWASKLHFYISGITFYNFPYIFGFLLTRGLFAMFQKEGADFLPRYEAFLRLSGSAGVERVARESLGLDLARPEFWAEAICSLGGPTAQLEKLYENGGIEKWRRF